VAGVNLSYVLPLIVNPLESIKDMKTFAGNLLRIDLNTSTDRQGEIADRYYQDLSSARGLSVEYLYDELVEGSGA
jgi:hypothetical protein